MHEGKGAVGLDRRRGPEQVEMIAGVGPDGHPCILQVAQDVVTQDRRVAAVAQPVGKDSLIGNVPPS
jgi:hypothetical protein